MGIVEQVKRITKWESAVVVMFTIACIFGTIVIGAVYSLEILYIGALIALGIPTSFFGNVTSRAVVASNSPSTSTLDTTDDKTLALAQMKVRMADLESKVELIKMFQDVENICGDEEKDE